MPYCHGVLSRALCFLLMALITCGYCLAQGVALNLSSGSGTPGSAVVLNLSLDATSDLPESTQWTLNYSTADFTSATIAPGPAAANKSLTCNNSAGTATCLVWGVNSTTIPNNVVASVTLALSSSTPDTSSSVRLTSGMSADSTGKEISTSVSGGTVTILQTPLLSGISCNPTSLTPTAGSTCTVTLTSAALSGGAAIAISASPAVANVPATVTVPQGSTSAAFGVTAGSVSNSTSVILTASYSGVNTTFGVTVNPPPPALSSISVSPSTLVSGQTGTGTVNLTSAAGTGGVAVALSSSNAAAATVPSTVTIPSGSNSASFITTAGNVSSPTAATLTASYSGASVTFGVTIDPPPPALSGISVSPSTLASGQSGIGTVSLTSAAGTGGVVVSLANSNASAASVPTTVTVPQGLTSTTFTVTALTISSSTLVTLTATTSAYPTASVAFGVTINPPAPALSSISVSPGTIVSGQSGTGTITLTSAAGTGGVSVSLSSSNTPAATVPSSVTVPQGSISATFTVSTGSVSSSTAATLTASYSGVNKTFAVTINPPAPALSSVSVNPSTLVSGQSGTGTVTLTSAAGTGGVAVALSSSNTTAATVPSTVTVPQGSSSVTFAVSTGNVSTSTPATLTASYSGVNATFGITVTPTNPTLSSVNVSPGTIVSGLSATGIVNLTAAAGSGGVSIALSSSNTNAATVPATVMVPQGSSSGTFTVSTGTMRAPTPATLTASLSGASATFGVTVDPPTPTVSVNPTSIVSGQSGTGTLTLTSAAGNGGVSVALSSSNTTAAIVPSSVTVPQGSTSVTFSVAAGTVSSPTAAILTASYSGVNAMFGVTINPPAAALSSLSVSASTIVSGQSGTGTVNLTSPAGIGGVTVSLSSSNPAAAGVPSSVTVPQGFTSVAFTVTAGTVSSPTAATLTASYSGVNAAFVVTVDPPAAALNSVSVSPGRIVSGQSGFGIVTLTASAGTGGVTVSLSTSGAATVPSSVIVPQGSTSVTFALIAGTVSSSTAVTLTGSYAGVFKTFEFAVIPVSTSTATASFQGMDTTTLGNWKTTYNYPNVTIIGDGAVGASPTPIPSGANTFVWDSSPTEIRNLETLSSTGRVAARWAGINFFVDIDFSDQSVHQVAIYCLDWNRTGRVETISVLDAATNTILDTRSVSNFTDGVYVLWNVIGHVKLQFTKTAGNNAVISGVFLK